MPTSRLSIRKKKLTCPRCGHHGPQTDFDVWGISRSRNQRYFDHQCDQGKSCLFAVPMTGKAIALEPFALVLLSYCRSKAYRSFRENHGLESDAELSWDDRYQLCLDVPVDDVYALASWVRANAPEVDTDALESWLRTHECVHGPGATEDAKNAAKPEIRTISPGREQPQRAGAGEEGQKS